MRPIVMALAPLCFILLFFFLLCPAVPAAHAGETVRVLVIDGEFGAAPGDGEELSRLDTLNGTFVAGSTGYAGKLEVWRGENGLYVINDLPVEEYVEGVVKAETGSDWALEALKAQAVAVRTYVAYQKFQSRNRTYHITSSVLHQLYKGRNADSLVSRAVRETKGQVLTYGGMPILAYYHSTSGRATELPEEVFGSSLPYIKSVSTPCSLSPLCLWAMRIPLGEIERASGADNIAEIRVRSRTATGRVKEVEILANPETVVIEAQELRKRLGWRRLPSTDFSVKVEGKNAVFEGRGYGHGVGLSQWSALEMAREGKTYTDILSYFYPGAELTTDENRGF